jgi:hypothetical protein
MLPWHSFESGQTTTKHPLWINNWGPSHALRWSANSKPSQSQKLRSIRRSPAALSLSWKAEGKGSGQEEVDHSERWESITSSQRFWKKKRLCLRDPSQATGTSTSTDSTRSPWVRFSHPTRNGLLQVLSAHLKRPWTKYRLLFLRSHELGRGRHQLPSQLGLSRESTWRIFRETIRCALLIWDFILGFLT